MEVVSDIRYGPCPSCSAINMAHRQTCYRCRSPLNGSEKPAPPVRRPPKPPPCEEKKNARRTIREEIRFPDVLIEGEVPLRHRVTVIDVSAVGLKIRSSSPIRLGAHVRIALPVEGRSYPLEGTFG